MSTSSSLSDQIKLLQDRYVAFIQQSSQELEQLRSAVDHQDQELQEADQLRVQLAELQAQREQERLDMQAVLDTLKDSIGGQLRGIHEHLRKLSLEALEDLEKALNQVDTTSFVAYVPMTFATTLPATTPRVGPVQPAIAQKVEKTSEPKKEAKPKKPRTFRAKLVRGFSFAAVLAVAWYGWQSYSAQSGQVAGVSTNPGIVSTPSPSASATPVAQASGSQPDYKEAQVDVPFGQTKWENFSDPDFGISIDHPTTTSDLVHAASSDNLFLVRKNGFMFKVNKISTNKTAAEYMQTAQGDYGTDYDIKPGTLNNRPAFVATPKVHDEYSGTMYFVPRPASKTNPSPAGTTIIYQVWVKDEPAGSDDARRLDRIINSFQFVNIS